MKLDTARPKRQIALVIVLFIHGLVFLGGFCVLGVVGTVMALSPNSEPNRLHRAPDPDEVARGQLWFSGHIEELRPGRTDKGELRPADPWHGCSMRAQRYRSGKNSGWYDDGPVYSYGSALVVSDEKFTLGRSVEVQLHRFPVGGRDMLTNAQAIEMLPTASPTTGTFRYVRDCFSAPWEVTVDGQASSDGVLQPIPGRVLAMVETRDARVSRLGTDAMLCSLGPLAFAGGFAWLALFLSVLRTPTHLSNVFGAALTKGLPGSPVAVAMPFVGLALGVTSYLMLFHSLAPIVLYVLAFSAFGVVLRWHARAVALRVRLRVVLTGVEVSGVTAAWGTLSRPGGEPGELGPPVIATEVYELTSKGALSSKIHTYVEPDPFTVTHDDVCSTCDGSSSNFFGECTQDNEDGHDVRGSRYGGPTFTRNRYGVRVTRMPAGSEIVLVGPSAQGADSRAPAAEDYRGSGTARFYRRDGAARVVVFQGTRDLLRTYIGRDLTTFRVYRVFLGLWLTGALSTLALAAKYTLFR